MRDRRKKLATREELRVADVMGARRVPLSGAGLEKGDVHHAGPFLGYLGIKVEVKDVRRGGAFPLSVLYIQSFLREAASSGEAAILAISLRAKHDDFPWRMAVCDTSLARNLNLPVREDFVATGLRSWSLSVTRWFTLSDPQGHLRVGLSHPKRYDLDLYITPQSVLFRAIDDAKSKQPY